MSGILILTASFGEGHNAAARNLREAITAASQRLPSPSATFTATPTDGSTN